MRARLSLLFALAPMLGACGHVEEPTLDDIRPVRSLVVGADVGAVGSTYSGQVRARVESKLGFQASGRIVRRLVDIGDHVKRGDVLMRIDPEQASLHVTSAKAEVDGARTKVADLETDLQRTEALHAKQFASQAEVDQARVSLAEARYTLESSQAKYQLQLNQHDYTVLVADQDGLVTAISAEVGQVVSTGQPVVTVAADGEREIQVSIPEARVDEIRRVGAFHVSLWSNTGKRYTGTLRELSPDTDSVSRTYAARIAVPDADAQLQLGMTASVFAADAQGTAGLFLPLTAILDRDGQPQVWIVNTATQQVATRDVTLGDAQGDRVIVTRGIEAGETVVTAGVHMLHPGQKVIASASGAVLAQAEAK